MANDLKGKRIGGTCHECARASAALGYVIRGNGYKATGRWFPLCSEHAMSVAHRVRALPEAEAKLARELAAARRDEKALLDAAVLPGSPSWGGTVGEPEPDTEPAADSIATRAPAEGPMAVDPTAPETEATAPLDDMQYGGGECGDPEIAADSLTTSGSAPPPRADAPEEPDSITVARAARDEAIAAVDGAADGIWKDAAEDIVRKLAATGAPFTTDRVWHRLDMTGFEAPREPRALGAVMQKLSRAGVIAKTGEMVQSADPVRHARPIPVWRGA